MNRLVIIGNGFDLAHGLNTSYGHFIDDYWKGVTSSSHEDDFVSFENFGQDFNFDQVENLKGLANFIMQYDDKIKFSDAEIYREYGNNSRGKYPRTHILIYKNGFFRLINQKSIQNWVDIENEYYKQLKGIVKLKPENSLVDEDEFEISRKEKIFRLNNEFELVKKLLEEYLNKIDKIQRINDSILKHFELIKINEEKYLTEFSKQDRRELEDFQNKYISERVKGKEITTYCLNFNYTQTINKYIDASLKEGEYRKYGIINNLHIHGRLNDKNNKINFGFGDEMDDDYKAIENLDDNEYLKNFKSFQYLQNSNYKILLDFIDSDKFQIFIMGHSCGLSDRTLLNTIFEHNNCRSIKVFYHQRKDGNDNYTEIIQNISRHFNKKKLMREKIVNKMLCEPLLKIQLPLK